MQNKILGRVLCIVKEKIQRQEGSRRIETIKQETPVKTIKSERSDLKMLGRKPC